MEVLRANCSLCGREFELDKSEVLSVKVWGKFICKVCRTKDRYKGKKKL